MPKNADIQLANLVAEHVNELVAIVTAAVRRSVVEDVTSFLEGDVSVRHLPKAPKRILPCIAPGCTKPSKGPRFRYLCDEHKGAKKSTVEAWRAARRDQAAAPAAEPMAIPAKARTRANKARAKGQGRGKGKA